MSLDDTPKLPPDMFELGDKLFTLPPNKMNMITQELYVMNHGKYSMFYYVQRYPPNPLSKPPELERLVVHFIPRSREADLKPE